jgi:carboxypeptidase PM20D1
MNIQDSFYSKAAEHLSKMLRCRTVQGNSEEFGKFEQLLKDEYRNIAKVCEFTKVISPQGAAGLIFRWRGNVSSRAVVYLSHFDVVPADTERWKYPPFDGVIAEGSIWGRGSIDTKCTLCAAMESIDYLIGQGFTPNSDIYCCFGGDEETEGTAAKKIVSYLKNTGIKPYLILDEGGAVVDGEKFGISYPCAMIGIAEKGLLTLEFIARSKGGHSSLPLENDPMKTMAKVIMRIDYKLFDFKITTPTIELVKSIMPYMKPHYKFVIKHHKIFGRLFRYIAAHSGPEIQAFTRTIGHITVIQGSDAINVIPKEVRAWGNFRVLSETTCDETVKIVKKALSDLDVEIKVTEAVEPSPVSCTIGLGWENTVSAIKEVFGETATVPYLVFGATDARQYSEISNAVYRFSPLNLDSKLSSTIHGINENIPIEVFNKMLRFYITLTLKS